MATDIKARLDAYRQQRRDLAWQGTFEHYFTIVTANPRVAQLAHARVHDMIMQDGIEENPDGVPRYSFFARELFGLEKPVAQIVDYFSAAAKRLEPRKRILLLMGPVGGGKSTVAILLREGLERYTRTPEGAVYAISGCPMHEEPLHLIPKELRAEIQEEYGLYIEGALCPSCNYRLQTEWDHDIYSVPVERVVFSAENRVGLGTFAPSDPKCVTGDTVLLSDRGMLRFDEIQDQLHAGADHFLPLSIRVAGRQGREVTSHFYNGGVKSTRHVHTRFGYRIEGSVAHPLLVRRDGHESWVRLREIRVGDRIALQVGTNLFGTQTLLPNCDAAVGAPDDRPTLPEHLNPDVARLLGCIVAAGTLTDTDVRLTVDTRTVLDDAIALSTSVFGLRARQDNCTGSSHMGITLRSPLLSRWLEKVCDITRDPALRQMPRVVRVAPREIVVAFLRGFFAATGVRAAHTDGRDCRCTMVVPSSEMAHHVQVTLLNLGIVASHEGAQGSQTAHTLSVHGEAMRALIDPIPSISMSYVAADDEADHSPHASFAAGATSRPRVLSEARIASTALAAPFARREDGATLRAAPTAVALLEREWTPDDGGGGVDNRRTAPRSPAAQMWVEVLEIEEGAAQVYDLTVPGSHSFCANGFVNHNSQDVSELVGSIDLSTIAEVGVESDPRAYRFDGEFNIANRGIVEFVEMLKCLRGDTLVFTEHGPRRLDALSSPDHPAGQSRPITKRLASVAGVERAAHVYHAGISATKRITTRLGFVQEGTAEHRVLVVDTSGAQVWRRHDELQVGDWLVLQKGQNLWGQDVAIAPLAARNRRSQPMRVPSHVTPDLARWLGHLTARGVARPDGAIHFSSDDPAVRADYCSLSSAIFGLRARVQGNTARIQSAALRDLLATLGVDAGSPRQHVPRSILASPRACVLAYVAGYLACSGSISRHGSLVWATGSSTVATQLQVLLLNMGAITRRTEVHAQTQAGSDRVSWTVSAHGADAVLLARALRLTHASTSHARTEARASDLERADVIPHTRVYWQRVADELEGAARRGAVVANGPGLDVDGGRSGGSTFHAQVRALSTGEHACTRALATRVLAGVEGQVTLPPGLAALLNPAQFYDEVVSIEDSHADCWDVNVPGSHTVIANGFVNHNCDEKLLYTLLTLTQEQNIKTGRFSLIYADEVVLSHTNENEFKTFAGNPKAEALHDRIILVKVPYNLRVSEEIKIYEKLLAQSNLSGVHIAPHTLHVASIFAVLSRLEPSKKASMTLMKKLKLYDGQDVEGWKIKDVKELQEEAQREGMDGISPRYIIDRLSNALIRGGVTCINPINALRALRDGFEQHTSFNREDREHLLSLIAETRREYDEMAKKEVQRAFVYAFEESAKTLLNNYLDNVEAYCRKDKMRDPLTDEEVDPDEKLMRSIEEQIGVTENGKSSFRESILMSMASLARRGKSFEYTSDERLKEALEKKLFADLKDVIKITTSTKTPDAEQLRRINEVVDRMVTDQGYCVVCAQETLQYVGQLLNR